MIDMDIKGKAIFIKSIRQDEHGESSDFEQAPMNRKVLQALETSGK